MKKQIFLIAFLFSCSGYVYENGKTVGKINFVSTYNSWGCDEPREIVNVSVGQGDVKSFLAEFSIFDKAIKQKLLQAQEENRFVKITYKSKRTDWCGPDNHIVSVELK